MFFSLLTLTPALTLPGGMDKPGSGVITTTQDVDCLEFDWGKIHFLSEPAVTGAERFSFGVVELAAGKGHARHNHPGSEEIIYVVSGEGEQMVDDQPPIKVGPGASIYIPADVYHSTVNTGAETLKLIVVYSPAGPERLLRDIPGCRIEVCASASESRQLNSSSS
jgi:oxalate decarboxylase/phosphoglucose isomerase-like protein (cupin superfamily)